MITQTILAALSNIGTDVAKVVLGAPAAADLVRALEIAQKGSPRGVFVRYVNEMVSRGMARPLAAQLYGAARYFANPANVLDLFKGPAALDPLLARSLPDPGGAKSAFGVERVQVGITLTDPLTGQSRRFGFLIDEPHGIVVEDAYALAWIQLQSVAEQYKEYKLAYSLGESKAKFEITDYVKFI